MEELFNKSLEYNEMLDKGLSLSGENKNFFIHGRLSDLSDAIPSFMEVKKIFDFGCGIGDTTIVLKKYFAKAEKIVGTDISSEALNYSRKINSDENIVYDDFNSLNYKNEFDLCYVNGVFHHIIPSERANALKIIYEALKPGGVLALFENNPLNPGTKIIMNKIPFDNDAIPLYHWETKRMLVKNGFSILGKTRFLFYFPGFLKSMRIFEKRLLHFPLGAQYCVLCQKNI